MRFIYSFLLLIISLLSPVTWGNDWVVIDTAHDLFMSNNGLKANGDTVTMWSKKVIGGKENISYDRYDCKNKTITKIDHQIYFLPEDKRQNVELPKPQSIEEGSFKFILFKEACRFKK